MSETGAQPPRNALQLIRPILTPIVLLSMLVGGGMSLWARYQLNNIFDTEGEAELSVAVGATKGLCSAPAIYIQPIASDGLTEYELVIDMLGGGYRHPNFHGAGRADAVITSSTMPQSSSRAPESGFGEQCEQVDLALSGEFKDATSNIDFTGLIAGQSQGESPLVVRKDEGYVELSYIRGPIFNERGAWVSLRLTEIDDRWQFQHRRTLISNGGSSPVDVFFLDDQQFLFMNENYEPIRRASRRRAMVAVTLAPPGVATDNSFEIVRRKPTYEVELQSLLINVSTIFGIGVSLFVEGFLLFLIALISRSRGPITRSGMKAQYMSSQNGDNST